MRRCGIRTKNFIFFKLSSSINYKFYLSKKDFLILPSWTKIPAHAAQSAKMMWGHNYRSLLIQWLRIDHHELFVHHMSHVPWRVDCGLSFLFSSVVNSLAIFHSKQASRSPTKLIGPRKARIWLLCFWHVGCIAMHVTHLEKGMCICAEDPSTTHHLG